MNAPMLAFNLGVNAAGSFAVALAVTWLGVKLFRVDEGAWRRRFLLIPLAKVVVDSARGIPAGSFFWARLEGVRQDVGSLHLGFGFQAPAIPSLQMALSARVGAQVIPQSAAEPLATGLTRHLGAWAPPALGALFAAVALLLLARSAWQARRALAAARLACAAATLVERRRVGRRQVAVLVSPQHRGSPFAGGLLRPHVCFSAGAFAQLPPDEREAVLQHELAHIASYDLPLLVALTVVADLFWFVPGLRWLCRAIAAQGEVAADARAVASGVPATSLASALVRVATLTRGTPSPALALIRPFPALASRVHRLLGQPRPAPRLGFHTPAGRALLTAWVAASALASTFLGNH